MNDKQQIAAMGEHTREMEECEPRITNDARIGGVVFKVGAKVSTVIEAAYRAAEHHKPNPKAFDSLIDSICSQSSSVDFKVPYGWRLVPIEPTCYQVLVGRNSDSMDDEPCVVVYLAMLAAAPEYKP